MTGAYDFSDRNDVDPRSRIHCLDSYRFQKK
nr:MAG TPA: hypothetical protein [Caudoviricetes sp.]